ncbi:MAG: DUF6477 family protein [Pseudomonadota bacterium]
MPHREPGQLAVCARSGTHYREQAIADAAAQYDRQRDLPRLLRATVEELDDTSIKGQRNRVARLLRLARNAARSGRAGHWTYDPHHHVSILGALKAEQAELDARTVRTHDEVAPPVYARTPIST